MKYQFYIVDTINGDVRGTNDEPLAEEYSRVDENYVIDAKLGKQICIDTIGQTFDIQQAKEIPQEG